MRCENSGAAYDEDNVEWTCKASLPPEFKLGSTDVICEGYSNPDDPYILKGSCGVEYRLILTEQGQEKYGKKSWWDNDASASEAYGQSKTDQFVSTLFWLAFIGVLLWMVYRFVAGLAANGNGVNRPVGGGGGGWGGGGGGNDDPPPPYDYQGYTKPRSSYTRNAAAGEQGWRPGFWSGAAGGTAAGYMMGQRAARNNNSYNGGGSSWFGSGNGEGSSRGWGGGGSSGSSAPSSSRHESTGFGSTRRR